MPMLNSRSVRKTPYIIATGFTTAFLGDERALREFIIGDMIKRALDRKGRNTVLYLINDSYDPLNYRQLRIGVNKDEKLLRCFAPYCGRPISEVPDPFGCHDNYSQHFAGALIKRLHSLNIYPVLLDSYHAYRRGYYADFIAATFENYTKIQEMISRRFKNFSMKNLFRIQCPKCSCLDATHIFQVNGREILFGCERCNRSDMVQDIAEVRGKLSWKLDCAARWNLYGIDLETFSKAHIAELGSYEISRFISQTFYQGKVPALLRYGDVKLSNELSFRLLEILPPPVLKALFVANRTRDLVLTKDSVENFCRGYQVRPGLSYVDYVRSELPKQAVNERTLISKPSVERSRNYIHGSGMGPLISPSNAQGELIEEHSLVAYGNRFSGFYYGREYGIRLPEASRIGSADRTTAKMAREVILYALFVRKNRVTEHGPSHFPFSTEGREQQPAPAAVGGRSFDHQDVIEMIRSYLHSERPSPQLFRYLRKILAQADGPNIVTLLAILPRDYLNVVQTILGYYVEQGTQGGDRIGKNDHAGGISALFKN